MINLLCNQKNEVAVRSPDVSIANAVNEYVHRGVGDLKQVRHNLEYLKRVVTLKMLNMIGQYYHYSLKCMILFITDVLPIN